MSRLNAVRADFNSDSIVVYQAYNDAIADAALEANRFVPPFSSGRMTWIKPSFLWLMERSNWGQKANQTRILKVRISRAGWDEALSLGVLTSFEAGVHTSSNAWREQFEAVPVHVQWDPERSLRGADLGINSIQVGLGRAVIERFIHEWTLEISDLTLLVRRIHTLQIKGNTDAARRLLPLEKPYVVEPMTARRLNIGCRALRYENPFSRATPAGRFFSLVRSCSKRARYSKSNANHYHQSHIQSRRVGWLGLFVRVVGERGGWQALLRSLRRFVLFDQNRVGLEPRSARFGHEHHSLQHRRRWTRRKHWRHGGAEAQHLVVGQRYRWILA